MQSYLSAITPTSHVPAGELWMGPVYQFATSGDTLRTWSTPEQMMPITLLALLEQKQGLTAHSPHRRPDTGGRIRGHRLSGSDHLDSRRHVGNCRWGGAVDGGVLKATGFRSYKPKPRRESGEAQRWPVQAGSILC